MVGITHITMYILLKGTYGHEQLTPAPQHTAKGMFFFSYNKLGKKRVIVMIEAGDISCPAGGKLNYCRCRKIVISPKLVNSEK
jgi:hypothetical protein